MKTPTDVAAHVAPTPGVRGHAPAGPGAPPRPPAVATAPHPGSPPVRGGAPRPAGATADWASRWPALLVVAALAWCVGWAFGPVFGVRAVVVTATVGAVVPVVVAVGCTAVGRFPLWTAGAANVLCGLVVACLTTVRDRCAAGVLPTPDAVRGVGRALADAPQTLLVTEPPVRAQPVLLVLVLCTVWVAALLGAELALRARPVALPALPAVLLVAGVSLLDTAGDGASLPACGTTVVLAGALALVRRAHRSPPRGGVPGRAAAGRAVLAPVATGALVAVSAAVLAPHLPGTTRHALDLRPLADQAAPVDLSGDNPLDYVSAWLRDPTRPLFTVSAPTAGPGQLWRLVVFDRFDGTMWRPVQQLRPSGGQVPAAVGVSVPTRRLVQRITVQRLPGPWLPAADRPVEADLPSQAGPLAVDPVSGVLAAGEHPADGTGYTVVSEVPQPDLEQAWHAPVSDNPDAVLVPQDDAAGNPIPAADDIAQTAQAATQGSTVPYEQAQRLADWLRTGYAYDPNAVPGHSYRNIQVFLHDSHRGTCEQFAAAYALMARSLGLPTRVVEGFRTPAGASGTVQIRGGDVTAWAEVEFEGLGWVPFFPTPDRGSSAPPPPDNGAVPPPPDQTRPAAKAASDPGAQADQPPPDPADDDTPPAGGHQRSSWALWALCAAVVVAVPLVWAAVRGMPAARRRRRRNRGSPGERVLGAWAQSGEVLRRVGLVDGGALTAVEVAGYVRRRLGPGPGDAAAILADLYNETAFGTPSGVRAQVRVGVLAWRCCAVVEAAVRAAERDRGTGRGAWLRGWWRGWSGGALSTRARTGGARRRRLAVTRSRMPRPGTELETG